jgi:hypothetical protein
MFQWPCSKNENRERRNGRNTAHSCRGHNCADITAFPLARTRNYNSTKHDRALCSASGWSAKLAMAFHPWLIPLNRHRNLIVFSDWVVCKQHMLALSPFTWNHPGEVLRNLPQNVEEDFGSQIIMGDIDNDASPFHLAIARNRENNAKSQR